jgi:hypothetical protein
MTKKGGLFLPKILCYMRFHEFFTNFSSQLILYKRKKMLYNIWCRWARAYRVPPCAHRMSFCESVNLMTPSSHGAGVPFYL